MEVPGEAHDTGYHTDGAAHPLTCYDAFSTPSGHSRSRPAAYSLTCCDAFSAPEGAEN